MEELHYISTAEITPNPYQPRTHFDEQQLRELADSIKENGIIQPLIVRKSPIIGYELLAGERRLRASQLLGLKRVPAIVKDLSNDEMLYQSIIENLQRADLNPIEEAKSYQTLLKKGLTHDDIAKIMGKSRPYITNVLRLLHLSEKVMTAVENGRLSQGHARLLVPYPDSVQEEWLSNITQNHISVRALEKALSQKKQTRKKRKDLYVQEEEEKLRQLLGTSVHIKTSKEGSGKVIIEFSDPVEFERIIQNFY